MVIMPDMLEHSNRMASAGNLWFNQITSNQAVRAYLSLGAFAIIAVEVLRGNPVPDLMEWLVVGLLGYYFGENVPIPNRNKIDNLSE